MTDCGLMPLHPTTKPPGHKSHWRFQPPQVWLGQHFSALIQTLVSPVPRLQQPFSVGVCKCPWGSLVAPKPMGWGCTWYWLAPRSATTQHGAAHPPWEIQRNLPPIQPKLLQLLSWTYKCNTPPKTQQTLHRATVAEHVNSTSVLETLLWWL